MKGIGFSCIGNCSVINLIKKDNQTKSKMCEERIYRDDGLPAHVKPFLNSLRLRAFARDPYVGFLVVSLTAGRDQIPLTVLPLGVVGTEFWNSRHQCRVFLFSSNFLYCSCNPSKFHLAFLIVEPPAQYSSHPCRHFLAADDPVFIARSIRLSGGRSRCFR